MRCMVYCRYFTADTFLICTEVDHLAGVGACGLHDLYHTAHVLGIRTIDAYADPAQHLVAAGYNIGSDLSI